MSDPAPGTLPAPWDGWFRKMHGSGNDFVVVDARKFGASWGLAGRTIERLCARGTGVGADGLVVIRASAVADVGMLYFNSDGERADLCGNATLCVARLAGEQGMAPATGMRIETDAGVLTARLVDGLPEVDTAPVGRVRVDAGVEPGPGERAIGFADSGVPHIVVICDGVGDVDVASRGRQLRHHEAVLPAGANVNFLSRSGEGGAAWQIRTYERGVEGETLACGTGAVASAILLSAWGHAGDGVALRTRAGTRVHVRLRREGALWFPSLRGPAAVAFTGQVQEV